MRTIYNIGFESISLLWQPSASRYKCSIIWNSYINIFNSICESRSTLKFNSTIMNLKNSSILLSRVPITNSLTGSSRKLYIISALLVNKVFKCPTIIRANINKHYRNTNSFCILIEFFFTKISTIKQKVNSISSILINITCYNTLRSTFAKVFTKLNINNTKIKFAIFISSRYFIINIISNYIKISKSIIINLKIINIAITKPTTFIIISIYFTSKINNIAEIWKSR